VKLSCDASAIAVGFRGSKTFAQLENLFFTGTAPANLRPTAGCRHSGFLLKNNDFKVYQLLRKIGSRTGGYCPKLALKKNQQAVASDSA
jgi:hypothetical protein